MSRRRSLLPRCGIALTLCLVVAGVGGQEIHPPLSLEIAEEDAAPLFLRDAERDPPVDEATDLGELLVAAAVADPADELAREWPADGVVYSEWTWQLLPEGLIYRDYLAGAKQSRFRSVWHEDFDEGSMWDVTLGGHVGLVRCGSTGCARPAGFQLDMEGSAQLRLNRDDDENLDAVDFRFGVPLSWGDEVYQTRFGYYHLSSHVGDEFLANNPGFDRVNFVRETILWGHSLYVIPEVRLYTEAGYAFLSDVSQPWEFQFGTDYSPACSTGRRGAPFAAINYHVREELDYDGNVVGQIGWAWRRSPSSSLFRLGLEYFHGRDEQFSFYRNSQNKLGVGAWYDY